jgi:multidrug resistance efflux pump
MKRKAPILILVLAALAAGLAYFLTRHPDEIMLTGIVTTDQVIVGPEIQGRLQQLLVKEGDAATNGQLLAIIQPQEWKADVAFYASSVQQSSAQIAQAEADLKYQEAQTSNQIRQAQATLASTEAQGKQAEADLENAKLTFDRERDLYERGVESKQAYDQARTSNDAAKARVDALEKQVLAAQAAVALAASNVEQVAARRAALEAMVSQKKGASAQEEKASVRLDYTQIRAPIDGIVDTRAALQGEVVNPGQAIVTLINQDNLWVRADIEETYIDRIHLGDRFQIKLPSGVVREGIVYYRAVDADYATQRDVSRTKRDIKTFETRLRCDNRDRSLAVGMTAYVQLPLERKTESQARQ